MNGYFSQAGVFLIGVVFGFYILMVMLRFLLQAVRADFYNPLSQFIVKFTTPVLRPLRRIIPGVGGVDLAAIVLLLLLQIAEIYLIALLTAQNLHPLVVLVFAIGKLVTTALYIFIIAIIVQAVLSWVQPGAYNPMTVVIQQLTNPILRPIRGFVPVFSGLDLSPLVALVILNLIVLAIPHLQAGLLQLLLG